MHDSHDWMSSSEKNCFGWLDQTMHDWMSSFEKNCFFDVTGQ
jgi:hypothetical protein